MADEQRRLLLDPVVVAVVEVALRHARVVARVGPAHVELIAPVLLCRVDDLGICIDILGDGLLEVLADPEAVRLVVADAREPVGDSRVFLEVDLVARLRHEGRALDLELDVVQDHLVVGVDLDLAREEAVVGVDGAALRLRAVVDDDLVGIELELLARHVVFGHFALGALHRTRARAVVVVRLEAIEHDLSLARRELQHMALARDVDALLDRVAVDVLALEAVLVELCDLDLALGREVTRHLVPHEVIALEGDRCGLCRVNRVAQVLAHLLRIGLELVFLGIRLLGARRAVLVLEVVEQAQARIGIGMIRRGAGRARCCRQDEGRDHQA